MKIGVLSTVPAVPVIEGNRSRIYQLVKALIALGNDVYFIYIPSDICDAPDHDLHRREFGDRNYIALPDSINLGPRQRLRRIFYRGKRGICRFFSEDASYYHALDEFYADGYTKSLRDLNAALHLDAIIVEYIFQSKALDAFGDGVLKVIDTHDSFSDRHKMFPDRSAYWFSVPPAKQAKALCRADVFIAIQDREHELLSAQVGGKVKGVTVSHFLDLDTPISNYDANDAVFVGSSNAANISAVQFFTQDVWPILRSRLPDFRLFLAGTVCSKVADHPGIVKLGVLDNLADAYRQASFTLNPVAAGTGINIKLLDAMAHAVPTVSTQTGARGLSPEQQKAMLITPDGDAGLFAESIVELASNPDKRRDLGRLAYDAAVSWQRSQIAGLEAILSSRRSRKL